MKTAKSLLVMPILLIIISTLALADKENSQLLMGNYDERIIAAQKLGSGQFSDTLSAINSLIEALAKEIRQPLSLSREHYSGFTFSEELKEQYCLSIESLMKNRRQLIIAALDSSAGELHDRLVLILAISGDDEMRLQARRIYEESQSGYLRYRAVLALEKYSDSLDVPIFEKALKDTFWVAEFIDPGNGGPINLRYPTRVEAASALTKLGFKIEWRGWDYSVIKKKE